MTDSTWNVYDGRMTTPLLRCAPLATPRGRCHGIHDEHLRRGAGGGSPLSFLAQGSHTLVPSSAVRPPAHVSASASRVLSLFAVPTPPGPRHRF
jgi:hypothetical protein